MRSTVGFRFGGGVASLAIRRSHFCRPSRLPTAITASSPGARRCSAGSLKADPGKARHLPSRIPIAWPIPPPCADGATVWILPDWASAHLGRDSASEAVPPKVSRESPARRFRGAAVQITASPAPDVLQPSLAQWRHLVEASRGWRSIGLHHLCVAAGPVPFTVRDRMHSGSSINPHVAAVRVHHRPSCNEIYDDCTTPRPR